MFEHFVAKVMQDSLGGKAVVTKSSGDFGVDIVHTIDGKLYLAQVKCYQPSDKIRFDPISILHSNMVKRGAEGGYFVTTSEFGDNAISYAEGLGIQLINGHDLAKFWLGKNNSWIDNPVKRSVFDEFFNGIDKLFGIK